MLQSLFRESFSLFYLAITAKVFLLFAAERLAQRMATQNNTGLAGRLACFVLFALAIFAAHNIALMNSFYQEYAFFLLLPVMLVALMSLEAPRWRVALVMAALMCGLAKIQFFYVPVLVVGALAYLRVACKHRLDAGLVGALLLVQAVCVTPLLRYSEYTATNRYNATFYGSYVVMTDAEIDSLGLTAEQRACIGVDAWGNRADDATAAQITAGHKTCITKEALPLGRVITPYVANPSLLFRLLTTISPEHYSSSYFHVSRGNRYLTSIRHDGEFGTGKALIAVSSVRDLWFLHGGFLLTAVLGLALPLVFRRQIPAGVAAVSLLLLVFALSQVVVCILGEGIRDLGRHLSAAQYAMDLLLVTCSIQAGCLVHSWARTR